MRSLALKSLLTCKIPNALSVFILLFWVHGLIHSANLRDCLSIVGIGGYFFNISVTVRISLLLLVYLLRSDPLGLRKTPQEQKHLLQQKQDKDNSLSCAKRVWNDLHHIHRTAQGITNGFYLCQSNIYIWVILGICRSMPFYCVQKRRMETFDTAMYNMLCNAEAHIQWLRQDATSTCLFQKYFYISFFSGTVRQSYICCPVTTVQVIAIL